MDDWLLWFAGPSGTARVLTTLAQFRRNRVNVDLGLEPGADSGDSDLSFGTVASRNQAIKVAFARLWPSMGRLVSQQVTPDATQTEYTVITDMHIVESIDFLDTNGRPYHDKANRFRYLLDYADPADLERRLRLPAAFGGTVPTLRVWGYIPYKSEFTGDADTLDIPVELEWIPTIGARAEIYRRQVNTRMNFERHATANRDNDVTVAELMAAYDRAQTEFDRALLTHARSFATGSTAAFA